MIDQQIAQCQTHITTLLDHTFNQYAPSDLVSAMRYACCNGGKRLRPLLAYLTGELFDAQWSRVDPVATAIELIHCYSLIHDDLPAMDNDDLRRGKPTCHKVYGEAMAILAGDALLTEAFSLLSQQKESYPPEILLSIIEHLSHAAGAQGMVKGQALDILAEGKTLSLETLQQIHAAKTGALIAASVQCGALATNRASKSDLARLQNFGELMGLAFQIQDDILDVIGTQAELGKTPGKDSQQQKSTFVSLLGLAKAKATALELHEAALAQLSSFGQKAQSLADLSRFMVQRVS